MVENGEPASFEQRSEPVSALALPYFRYALTANAAELMDRDRVTIEVARLAPAFGRDGGAMRVIFYGVSKYGRRVRLTVQMMLDRGYLR
jgi:hypothetical protein